MRMKTDQYIYMKSYWCLSSLPCVNFIVTLRRNDILLLHLTVTFTTTGVTSESETVSPSGVHEFSPVFSGVRVVRSSVFCVLFWRLLLVPLSFFFWPFRGLSFDLRILITPLLSLSLIESCC